MDRAFADAVILAALERDPEHVSEVIANVVSQLQAQGHSTAEIAEAVDELLEELSGKDQPRH
jgi:hypothetical protein